MLDLAKEDIEKDLQEKIETFLKYLNESDNIVFFGGAGVSTES